MNAVADIISDKLLVNVAFSSGPAWNKTLEAQHLTLKDFAALLATPGVGEKDGSYYVRGGDLSEPKRGNEYLRTADLLILDGDSRIDPKTGEVLQGAPPMELATAVLDQLGLAYAAHTSHSYVAGELEKWRIVIPAKIASAPILEICVAYITAKLHAAGVMLCPVKEMKTWSQAWYLPRVRDAGALETFKYAANLEGRPFPVGDAVAWHVMSDDAPQTETAPMRPNSAKRGNVWTSLFPARPSVIEQFNAEHGLDWVRGELEARGYRYDHQAKGSYRYTAPGSTSGMPGVTVSQGERGDWCIYSHHGEHDPLSGQGYLDPFGLFALFYHGSDLKAAARTLWEPTSGHGKTGSANAPADDIGRRTDPDGLILNSKGRPVANIANVLTILRTSPEWQGVVAEDRMAAKIMLQAALPDVAGRKPNDFRPHPLTDGGIVKAAEWFQRHEFPTISKETVGDGLALFAQEHGFDPLEDKLRSLTWDGVPRIDSWLQTYCGVELTDTQPEPYVQAVGRCWLISAAARALRPGCKVDTALVLVGPQGIGKSTAGRILAYEWFSDALPPVHTKDASDHLRGVWIVELGEMATASKADVEEMKAFMTRTTERFRPAYGRMEVEYPRRNVFFGTSNRDTFLRDETGNRRFWPVVVSDIDLAALLEVRDQLWAEAVHAFDQGKQWHLTDDEGRLAAGQQAAFVVTDERSHELSTKLKGQSRTTTLECARLLEMKTEKRDQMEVAAMLRELGWQKKTNGVEKFWVAPLTTSPSQRWSVGGQNDENFG